MTSQVLGVDKLTKSEERGRGLMNTNINDHTEEGAPEMVVKTEAEMQEGVDGGYWALQNTRNRVWEGVEVGSIRTCCMRLSGVEQ